MVINEKTNVTPKDWDAWDVRYALAKKGYSLSRIGVEYGYSRRSPSLALRKSWPAMEHTIAQIIGLKPWEIWPSRYNKDGNPKKGRGIVRLPKNTGGCND